MYYKLSYNSSLNSIEEELERPFRYPKLYKRNPILNGFDEVSLLVIIEENPKEMLFGIWGMLPKNFIGDWEEYQNIHNSLNISLSSLKAGEENDMENLKKCVIVTTGFFTNYLKNGEIYIYYVHLEQNKPFLLAGVYNILDDGFITSSLVLTKSNSFLQKINNTGDLMPLVLDKEHLETWLNTPFTNLDALDNTLNEDKMFAHTISKQFYENDILFDSVLAPKFYNGIPNYFSPDNSYKHPQE